ncbi:hypothetical protein ACNQGP_13265 [Flavobacterium sp. GT2N3]
MKISNRDIKIFFLGFATLFIVQSIYDWDSTIGEIQRGWEASSK